MLGLLVGQQRLLSMLAHSPSSAAATSQAASALLNLTANAHALHAHPSQPHSPPPLSAFHQSLAHSSTHSSSTPTAHGMSTSAQPALRQPPLPQPILSPPSHVSVSAHPPVSRVGPLTVQYPFPVEYYSDKEVVVRNLARGSVQGLEVLPGPVFNVPVRLDLLHRVVRWLRAAWQQGTHKTKRRSEVRGGGKKPWPQKGTGRARHGSIRSPIFRKGGVAHGPKPRSHAHQLPLPIQLHGYKCALSARANEGRLILVDSLQPLPVGGEFGQLPESNKGRRSKSKSSSSSDSTSPSKPMIKTKATLAQLQALLQGSPPFRSALLVDSGPEAPDGGEALRKGARNLPWVTIMPWYEVTVYDLLKHGALIMTTSAAAQLAQRLLRPPLHYKQVRKPLRLEWMARQQAALGEALAQLQQAAAHTPAPARQRRWLYGKTA